MGLFIAEPIRQRSSAVTGVWLYRSVVGVWFSIGIAWHHGVMDACLTQCIPDTALGVSGCTMSLTELRLHHGVA